MKKFVVAGIAAVAFCGAPALAAPPAAPMFNWSGFYIGVNGGGMDFSTSGTHPNDGGVPWKTNRKEIGIGGIHGGFQGQWGNIVAGIEGAWEAALGSGFSKSTGDAGAFTNCPAAAIFECQARINSVFSVGPRVGFAMGQWMIYGTGGYARAQIESRFLQTSPVAVAFAGDNHHNGWYAGGGVDFLVLNGLALGAEYKHYDFSSEIHAPGQIVTRDLKAKADTVLLRLTIKGGG